MKITRYSRWDGTLAEFSLDARRALDALSELMMEGLSASEALEWMRQHGFELGGLEMRVIGLDDFISELRDDVRELYERYDPRQALDPLRERSEDILRRERASVRERHGFESSRMNDFQDRRHGDDATLSDAIDRFRDYAFEDDEAGDDFAELVAELDRLRALEKFLREHGERFQGDERADYETAQRIRERIEAIDQLSRDLVEGDLQQVSLETLRELLGEHAARSLVILRDLESSMRRAGYLRGEGDAELTPRAIRRIGAHALAEVYGALERDRPGGHDIDARGAAVPRPDETKPFEFGDPLDLDAVRTLLNAVKRTAAEGRDPGALPIRLRLEDFELRERDYTTQTTTVLLLDMSWSMRWSGRFPAAKRVALALDHLVRTRYPRDHFHVVGFSTRARELAIHELPEISWDMGDPFTNLQEGLMVAERLIQRNPSASPQVLVVTDGQPTAYFVGGELRVEWPMGYGSVSPRAVAETMKQVRRISSMGVTINTFMLDDAPELVGFVEHLTQVNRGRAFFTRPAQLGSFLMVDYLQGSRKRRA